VPASPTLVPAARESILPTISGLAETAAPDGGPAGARILRALLDGRAFTAGELAQTVSLPPQGANAHLARLTEAGIVVMERQGRHRYFRLASQAMAGELATVRTRRGPLARATRRCDRRAPATTTWPDESRWLWPTPWSRAAM
jgi:DNA-binding transcriptional ArsR family regulator